MGEFLTINKSKMTNADHFNFMEEFKLSLSSVDISDNAKLTAAFGEFNDAFTEEDNYYMLSRANQFTDDINKVDNERDNAYSTIRNIATAWSNCFVMSDEQAAGQKIKNIIDVYNIDINKRSSTETAQITNLVADLQSANMAANITLLKLTDILLYLSDKNEEFKGLILQRNAINAQKQNGALRNARNIIDEKYDALVQLIEAYSVILDNPEGYNNFINAWNINIERYRRILNKTTYNPSEDDENNNIDGDDNNDDGGNDENNNGDISDDGTNTIADLDDDNGVVTEVQE